MTQQDKKAWEQEAAEALADACKTVDRLIASNQKYKLACQEALDELSDRYDDGMDDNAKWMARHIINLRNALPPTVSPSLAKRAEPNTDMAGLVWKMGQTSMQMAQAANR